MPGQSQEMNFCFALLAVAYVGCTNPWNDVPYRRDSLVDFNFDFNNSQMLPADDQPEDPCYFGAGPTCMEPESYIPGKPADSPTDCVDSHLPVYVEALIGLLEEGSTSDHSLTAMGRYLELLGSNLSRLDPQSSLMRRLHRVMGSFYAKHQEDSIVLALYLQFEDMMPLVPETVMTAQPQRDLYEAMEKGDLETIGRALNSGIHGSNWIPEVCTSLFLWSIDHGHTQLASSLLTRFPLDPSMDENLPMKLAIRQGNSDMCKTILNHDRFVSDDSLLLMAIDFDHYGLIKVLLPRCKVSKFAFRTAASKAIEDPKAEQWLQVLFTDPELSLVDQEYCLPQDLQSTLPPLILGLHFKDGQAIKEWLSAHGARCLGWVEALLVRACRAQDHVLIGFVAEFLESVMGRVDFASFPAVRALSCSNLDNPVIDIPFIFYNS